MLVERLHRLLPYFWLAPRGAAAGADENLLHHYRVERELADRLRSAGAVERRTLYAAVYDELMRRVPQHPQLLARFDPQRLERRNASVDWQFSFLRRFLTPRTVFMEIGAGDCALSLRAASYADQVYAVEVSAEIVAGVRAPSNMKVLLCDGLSVPVPDGSVHVAFSNQLMEHLHPEDAAAQLRDICRSLAPGGVYFCITPNRFYGPRDVSQHFDEVATGLHLREYSAREMRRLLLDSGFSQVRFYAGGRGRLARVPFALVSLYESFLARLPYRLRKPLADNAPARALLGLRVAAIR